MAELEPPWVTSSDDSSRIAAFRDSDRTTLDPEIAARDDVRLSFGNTWLPIMKLAQQADHEVIVFLDNGMTFRGTVSADREIGGIDLTNSLPTSVIRGANRITLVPKGGPTIKDAPRWHVVLLEKIVAITEVNR